MSTFAVLNVLDSGPGSLREAIQAANSAPGADLIRFAPAARDGTITLTSGELSITDDLVLDGPGVNRLTISGNDATAPANVPIEPPCPCASYFGASTATRSRIR